MTLCFFLGPLYPVSGTSSPASDDGSSPRITLQRPFVYFGQTYNYIYVCRIIRQNNLPVLYFPIEWNVHTTDYQLYNKTFSHWIIEYYITKLQLMIVDSYLQVNQNGHLTFTAALSSYTPQRFPMHGSRDIIAPFWTDLDNRENGHIYYNQFTSGSVLQQATQDINTYFPSINFNANWVFVATWYGVAYYPNTRTVSCSLLLKPNPALPDKLPFEWWSDNETSNIDSVTDLTRSQC